MQNRETIFEKISRINATARNGLVYSDNRYDIERYEEIVQLTNEITSYLTEEDIENVKTAFPLEKDYITPKVDIRGVVFNEQGEILLVRESVDGGWSLPGGWADIGFTPGEVVCKEVKEEAGLDVEPVRVLAVLEKRKHPHPPASHFVYKIFILCHIIGGQLAHAFDILDCGFFAQDNLPPLSTERTVKSQIDLMFEYYYNPQKAAVTD